MAKSEFDVTVVGGGNAAFSAALAAQEQGASVLMLEAAPEDESGGNSRFTAGSVRVVYNGVDDIKALVPDLTDQEIADTDFGTYTADQFFDDMARVTQNRADPDLVELLVTKSFDTFCWMRDKGVRFIPIYGRQAFKIDGKFKFWGGLTVESVGGGPGLVNMLTESAKKRGIDNLKVTFSIFNSGGAAVDAVLSGNVDLATSGATNLLTAWSATKGTPNEVRGVAGNGALPMFLLSRDPKRER